MKLVLQSLLALGLIASAAACNTVEGAGRDVEYAGERIEDASDTVEEELDDE